MKLTRLVAATASVSILFADSQALALAADANSDYLACEKKCIDQQIIHVQRCDDAFDRAILLCMVSDPLNLDGSECEDAANQAYEDCRNNDPLGACIDACQEKISQGNDISFLYQ